MDDILVFSKDKKQHQEQVKGILEKFRNINYRYCVLHVM